MDQLTLEVQIDDGRIVARNPEKLPAHGTGLLTITSSSKTPSPGSPSKRVQLPLIRGNGRRIVNPTADQLDASLWGD
jgi:hypothetical protein